MIESRASTRLGENVKLLTFVSVFFIPLSFCTVSLPPERTVVSLELTDGNPVSVERQRHVLQEIPHRSHHHRRSSDIHNRPKHQQHSTIRRPPVRYQETPRRQRDEEGSP